MKSMLRSNTGLFLLSLLLNVVALFALAVPFQWCWNIGVAEGMRFSHLNYLQAAALLGAVMVVKMVVIGVKFTAER